MEAAATLIATASTTVILIAMTLHLLLRHLTTHTTETCPGTTGTHGWVGGAVTTCTHCTNRVFGWVDTMPTHTRRQR